MVRRNGDVVMAKLDAPISPTALRGRGSVVRFTVRDAVALLDTGVIAEDASTELLSGIIVHKDRADWGDEPTVIGKVHSFVTGRLAKLSSQIDSPARHGRSQQPLVCGEDHMPEPDFAVVRGSDRDYLERLPTAADAFCVVEVADGSYERDTLEKLPRYATAGVPQYVVIDLRHRRAEVYESPDPANSSYAPARFVEASGSLSIRVGDGESFELKLADLLP